MKVPNATEFILKNGYQGKFYVIDILSQWKYMYTRILLGNRQHTWAGDQGDLIREHVQRWDKVRIAQDGKEHSLGRVKSN